MYNELQCILNYKITGFTIENRFKNLLIFYINFIAYNQHVIQNKKDFLRI